MILGALNIGRIHLIRLKPYKIKVVGGFGLGTLGSKVIMEDVHSKLCIVLIRFNNITCYKQDSLVEMIINDIR